jgi:predicted aspartyl protease
MSRYRYNHQVDPPAPFAYASVGAAAVISASLEYPAQLDTAADMSVVPWRVVEELQLDPLGEFEALGLGGHLMTLPTFLVRIQLRGLPPRVVEVLASPDEPYVLLGRDVLNRFRVTLDGPNLVLEIE